MQKMISENHAKTMENLRETIMGHMKNEHYLNPTQISLIQDRLKTIVSQFHTPRHLPYAAMIQRAIMELKQKGGATEKSISEFIKREYDDLPWAHCSLLKHHLRFLSERGEISVTRRFRYSLSAAGSRLGSMKGSKKHGRKKWRWNFERKQAKRLKLATVVRSEKENEIEVIKYPSQVNDQNSQVAVNSVVETEQCQNDGHRTPKQDGTIDTALQLADGGENDTCSGSKAMDTDHPPLVVLTDGCKKQVGLEPQQEQVDCLLKLHDHRNVHAMELENEDAIHELLSPESAPGSEFMGGEVSDSQDCAIVDSHPLQISKLIATEGNLLPAPTVSPLLSEKKKQHKNALPTQVVAEKLEKDNSQIEEKKHEKKEGRFLKGRQCDKMLEKREVLLALPHLPKGSPLLRDELMQNERSCRQLRRWSGDLPDISRTVCDSTQL